MSRKKSNKGWGDISFCLAGELDATGRLDMYQALAGDLQGPARVTTHANRLMGSLCIALHPPFGGGNVGCWASLGWGLVRASEATAAGQIVVIETATDDDSDEPWLWREWHTFLAMRDDVLATDAIYTQLRGDGAQYNHIMNGSAMSHHNVLPTRIDIPFRGGKGTMLDHDVDIGFVLSVQSWGNRLVTECGLSADHGDWVGNRWRVVVTFYGTMLFTQA